MSLPAELRTTIYEHCLRDEREVHIEPNLKQPALLWTCRRIRDEALAIWYRINSFAAYIDGCNARLLGAFSRHLTAIESDGDNEVKIFIYIFGKKDWAMVLEWCKDIWRDESTTLNKSDDCNDMHSVVAAAHDIVLKHRGDTWKACEESLENLRFVVCKLDPAWK